MSLFCALPACVADHSSLIDSDTWFSCALAERDATAGKAALEALGDNTFGENASQFTAKFGQGLLVRAMKDEAGARAAFTAARVEQEKLVQAQVN